MFDPDTPGGVPAAACRPPIPSGSMTPRKRPQLTLGELRAAKLETIIGVVIVIAAVIAAGVSFWQVLWAAGQIGIPKIAAWGFPVIVDGIGAVLAALTMVMHGQPFRRRLYVWTLFLSLLAVSMFCNTLHAVNYVTAHPMDLPPSLRGATWGFVALLAAIPPGGSAIGMHVFAFTRRHGVVSHLRATGTDVRTVHGAPAAQPPAHPAEPRRPRTNPPAQPAAAPDTAPSGPPRTGDTVAQPDRRTDAAPPPARASQVPPGRPASVNTGSWRRHWTEIPEFLSGWHAYAALREEGDPDPQPSAIKERALAAGETISGDRSRVSRWRPLYEARWHAEHADTGATPDPGPVREPVNGQASPAVREATPGGAPRNEDGAPDGARGEAAAVNGAPVAAP